MNLFQKYLGIELLEFVYVFDVRSEGKREMNDGVCDLGWGIWFCLLIRERLGRVVSNGKSQRFVMFFWLSLICLLYVLMEVEWCYFRNNQVVVG